MRPFDVANASYMVLFGETVDVDEPFKESFLSGSVETSGRTIEAETDHRPTNR